MFRRHPPPLDARVEADRPITGELLAVVSGQPVELAGQYRDAWFAAAHNLAASGVVLVFDELVIGPPCPLLLEAVIHVRDVRRAEHLGLYDDEEDEWYEAHADDHEAFWEPPTIPQRALAVMASGQEHDRLADGAVVARDVFRSLAPDIGRWLPFIRMERATQRLLVELADGICIGAALVLDARLAAEQADGWRWAA